MESGDEQRFMIRRYPFPKDKYAEKRHSKRDRPCIRFIGAAWHNAHYHEQPSNGDQRSEFCALFVHLAINLFHTSAATGNEISESGNF